MMYGRSGILFHANVLSSMATMGNNDVWIPQGRHTEHGIIRVDYYQQLSSIICKSKIGYFTLIAENETFWSYRNICIES
jgi:hypothetical protein